MYPFLLLFLLFFTQITAYCQFEHNYHPLSFTDTIPADINQWMKTRLLHQKSLTQAENLNKEVFKYKYGLYETRTNTVVEQFNSDLFMIDSVFTKYLERISDRIYAHNPQLKKDTKVFAYRSGVPNAVCFGEGTIAINLGLIQRMENESQIAFVLCHELAHYHLKHGELRINKLTHLNFDKNLKKELEEISNNEYNRFSKAMVLYKDLVFDVTKHSRTNENEADSVGLSYLLKTEYNPFESIRTMEILDSCDRPRFNGQLDIKNTFDFDGYKFKDSWLESETLNFTYAKKDESQGDSASTHPDCKKRMVLLEGNLKNQEQKKRLKKDLQGPYGLVCKKSDFEVIETSYHYNRLGYALYNALVLLQQYPENVYLHAMVGKCLTGIYHHQMEKNFGKAVALPDARFSEDYNRYLNFLHNLRLTEISKLATMYLEKYESRYKNDEEFLYALILSTRLPTTKLDKNDLVNVYKSKFAKGKYINQVKTL